jgi:hypothetical protein
MVLGIILLNSKYHYLGALSAFRQAICRCSPGTGVVFHSDQGVQYACQAFRDLLKEHKFVQ